jgi:hypothetical protein
MDADAAQGMMRRSQPSWRTCLDFAAGKIKNRALCSSVPETSLRSGNETSPPAIATPRAKRYNFGFMRLLEATP